MLRTPTGWFVFGLLEFLVVAALLVWIVPAGWPAAVQAGVTIAAFVGLVAFNLWLQRRWSRPR
ncbi:MAG TPA: hypothetical protein VIB62_06455 [Actinomycetota bacterium]|jgi:hypothetical protein